MNIRATIVVPVYNLQETIGECIDSLISQTEDNIEIVLVDDGSTDQCPQICDDYAERDSRIKVIHQENKGLSGARNAGIRAALGNWVMIVDPDDWLEPNAVDVLCTGAEKNQSDIFIASFFSEYKKTCKDSFFNVSEFHFTSESELEKLQIAAISKSKVSNVKASTNVGVTWARVYRKSFISDNDLTFVVGLNRTQDAIFNLYAFQNAKKVDFEDIPIHHYRIWSSSASRKSSEDLYLTAEEILHQIAVFIKKYDKSEEMINAMHSKAVRLLIEVGKALMLNTDKSFFGKARSFRCISKRKVFNEGIQCANYDSLGGMHSVFLFLMRIHFYDLALFMCAAKNLIQNAKQQRSPIGNKENN